MLSNQKSVNQLDAGEKIQHFFLLSKIEIKITKTNKEYLDLEFRDKSASIVGRMWDNIDDIKFEVAQGNIVKVTGQVEKYQDVLQVKVEKMKVADENDNISIEDFLPRSERNLDEMLDEFDGLINSIKNQYLKRLLKLVFAGKNLDEFIKMPAGKMWHHSYIHGVLEHSLEVAKICELVHSFHPDINRDLMLAGALLHDFGKVFELQYKPTFDYTDQGKLLGHIVLATIEIEKRISQIPNFPDDLKNQIIHLVLSHQGKLEHASPIEPKMAEAIALYYADELSAKTNAYKGAIKEQQNSGKGWTNFIKLADTDL
ncbi:MAG: HD domain-containing protein, partial [Ignavibacteriales bacterium]|nr:HD domain-containing protein [Ignavibacteriales bacterium]